MFICPFPGLDTYEPTSDVHARKRQEECAGKKETKEGQRESNRTRAKSRGRSDEMVIQGLPAIVGEEKLHMFCHPPIIPVYKRVECLHTCSQQYSCPTRGLRDVT